MKQYIATFGEIVVEIMATEINQSFLSAGTFTGPFPSGAPAIFINQVALLQEPARMYSCIGDDNFGTCAINRLAQSGVDTSCISTTQERATGVAFIRYNTDGSRNFIYHIDTAACGLLHKDAVPTTFFDNVSYLHIMGTSLYNQALMELALHCVDTIKQSGGKISFDANIRPEIIRADKKKLACLRHIASKSDVYFAGEDENQWLLENTHTTHAQSHEDSIVQFLYSCGVSTIIIKRAEKGATVYCNHNERVDKKAMPITSIDPTGAGDCFAGAFIAAINKGIPIQEALDYAIIAGAMAVSKQGPMEGAIHIDTMKKYLRKLQ